MSRFLSESLSALKAYTPGEQPQDKKYIKLNTNESPFPPSQGVIDAVNGEKVANLRLYSDPECKLLKEQLATVYSTTADRVFVSNGSDEVLNFAFMAYGKNGVAFADITYGFYSVFCDLYGLEADIVPLNQDFSLNVDGFCGKNKLVVIANPNAPTGMDISLADIEKILQSNKDNVVIIDEAYVDFGGTSSAELTKKYKNLLCVQTFSKSRSMAGARLGFAIADKEIIADLEKIKYSTNPYNVNSLTQVAGLWALKENDYYMQNAKRIIENREWTINELKKLGFEVLPSKANFIFASSDKIPAAELASELRKKGILVRYFNKAKIDNYLRITVGTDKEMQTLVDAVKEIIK
jgi:histidinol-phosphate aminotransferase